MQTFALVDGDLVLGPHGHRTVSGAHKAAQDLGVALRERYAHDRFHPEQGSLLPSFIGEPISRETTLRIESEVQRVVLGYMQRQSEQSRQRALRGQKAAHSEAEVVVDVQNIEVLYTGQDRYDVVISLRTADGKRVTLRRSVEG